METYEIAADSSAPRSMVRNHGTCEPTNGTAAPVLDCGAWRGTPLWRWRGPVSASWRRWRAICTTALGA